MKLERQEGITLRMRGEVKLEKDAFSELRCSLTIFIPNGMRKENCRNDSVNGRILQGGR